MRLKKFLAGIGAFCLCSALLLPVQAQAADQSSGTTTLTTTVPSTHEVQLVIGDHGSVNVNGTEYNGTVTVEIPRLAEQTYTVVPDHGYQIDTVTYGLSGSEEAVELTESSYTAPALNQDGNILTVTFEKTSSGTASGSDNTGGASGGQSGSGTGNTAGNKTGSVQTGDETNIFFWVSALAISFLLIVSIKFLMMKRADVNTDNK